MIKPSLVKKMITHALKLWNGDQNRRAYHFAYAVQKNKIIEYARNDPERSDTKIFELGMKHKIQKFIDYPYPHAEAKLLLKLENEIDYSQISMFCLRLNRQGDPMFSKPCPHCSKLLNATNVHDVWYLDTYTKSTHTITIAHFKQESFAVKLEKQNKTYSTKT